MESLTNKNINERTEYLSWKTMWEKLTIKQGQKQNMMALEASQRYM